jgi:hypothetical protein
MIFQGYDWHIEWESFAFSGFTTTIMGDIEISNRPFLGQRTGEFIGRFLDRSATNKARDLSKHGRNSLRFVCDLHGETR